jgi:hypothetical protein
VTLELDAVLPLVGGGVAGAVRAEERQTALHDEVLDLHIGAADNLNERAQTARVVGVGADRRTVAVEGDVVAVGEGDRGGPDLVVPAGS